MLPLSLQRLGGICSCTAVQCLCVHDLLLLSASYSHRLHCRAVPSSCCACCCIASRLRPLCFCFYSGVSCSRLLPMRVVLASAVLSCASVRGSHRSCSRVLLLCRFTHVCSIWYCVVLASPPVRVLWSCRLLMQCALPIAAENDLSPPYCATLHAGSTLLPTAGD